MFKAIIPSMVNVLEQCIKDEDTDNASKIFEVFDNLLMMVIGGWFLYCLFINMVS